VLSINYFLIFILELMRQHSNYLRFRISMDYHFRDNQMRQLCRFFFKFFLCVNVSLEICFILKMTLSFFSL
jgi:hypothetical protein